MYSETTIIGYISQPVETGTTKNGAVTAKTRIETAEMKADGKAWRNWIPILAFGSAAGRLGELAEGDCIALRGRLTWQSDTGGLVVVVREVSRFVHIEYSQAAVEAGIDA